MKRIKKRGKMEPVISLINIVFLILIFFMVTGTLSQQNEKGLQFIQTKGLECCVEPDALVVSHSGRLLYKGEEFSSPADYLKLSENPEPTTVKLLPEKELPAQKLLKVISLLQEAGAKHIVVLTENTAR